MPNTEDIEAKLCAYVDGDIDEAGRGEIERHLASNPQHRKLIDDLTQQRAMLRALPRARAPVDVAETLNAQLERSALLSEDDWRDQPIRLSRWPQIRAAAAVLFLVVGLAAVVYYVVPSPNQPNPAVVFNNVPEARDLRATEAVDSATRPGLPPTGVVDVSGKPDHDMAMPAPPGLSWQMPEAYRDALIADALAPQLKKMRDLFASSTATSRGAVKVVVAAADPDDASRHVQAYLQRRNVRVEPQFTDAAMPQALAMDDRAPQWSHITVTDAQGNKQTVEIPDFPRGNEPARPADNAPAAQGFEQAGGGAREQQLQQREQTYAARLPRREVALLCEGVSNEFAGRVARVEEEDATRLRAAKDAGESPEFAPLWIGDWNSLFPWLAKSESSVAVQEKRMNFPAPAEAQDADEVIDVLIVVRPDPALQLQQQQQAAKAKAPDLVEPAPEPLVAPTTEPATAPASQD